MWKTKLMCIFPAYIIRDERRIQKMALVYFKINKNTSRFISVRARIYMCCIRMSSRVGISNDFSLYCRETKKKTLSNTETNKHRHERKFPNSRVWKIDRQLFIINNVNHTYRFHSILDTILVLCVYILYKLNIDPKKLDTKKRNPSRHFRKREQHHHQIS